MEATGVERPPDNRALGVSIYGNFPPPTELPQSSVPPASCLLFLVRLQEVKRDQGSERRDYDRYHNRDPK